MNRFENLLSYLYPIVIERTESEVNPILEVVFQDGKYMLNSSNTNYSYGGLYELFKQVFKNVSIDWSKVQRALILGFGAGCTVPLIQQYQPNCAIVGVEVDGKVIELGKKYFNLDKLVNTKVIVSSAYGYINSSTEKYDLIIIDIFVDVNVPKEVETKGFLIPLKNLLNENGLVIFNKLMPTKSYKKHIPELKNIFEEVFGNVKLYQFMGTGQIFVSIKKY